MSAQFIHRLSDNANELPNQNLNKEYTMRPYGIPRLRDAEFPDKADIKRFGYASTDRCSRADRGKNSSRRIWAKKARNASIREIRESI